MLAPAASLCVAVLYTDSVPPALRRSISQETAFVRSFSDDDATDVIIVLTESESSSLRAPGWTGVVGALYFQVGSTLESGTPVAMVGGSVVTAIHSEVPFTRALSVGAKGADVAALQTVIKSLGFYAGSISGRFDEATYSAVLSWRSSLGDVAPTGAFDPADIVWLPTPAFVVGATTLTVGAPSPPAGEIVISGPPQYEASILHSSDRSSVNPISPGYELIVDADSFGEIEVDGLSQSQIQHAAAIAERDASPDASALPSTGPRPLELRGILILQRSVRRTVVPASAVISDVNTGTTCVIVVSGDSRTQISTNVVGGSLGVVYIEPSLEDGTEVVSNPLDVTPTQSC